MPEHMNALVSIGPVAAWKAAIRLAGEAPDGAATSA